MPGAQYANTGGPFYTSACLASRLAVTKCRNGVYASYSFSFSSPEGENFEALQCSASTTCGQGQGQGHPCIIAIPVYVVNNQQTDGNRSFHLKLMNMTGVAIDPNSKAEFVIMDDDSK